MRLAQRQTQSCMDSTPLTPSTFAWIHIVYWPCPSLPHLRSLPLSQQTTGISPEARMHGATLSIESDFMLVFGGWTHTFSNYTYPPSPPPPYPPPPAAGRRSLLEQKEEMDGILLRGGKADDVYPSDPVSDPGEDWVYADPDLDPLGQRFHNRNLLQNQVVQVCQSTGLTTRFHTRTCHTYFIPVPNL